MIKLVKNSDSYIDKNMDVDFIVNICVGKKLKEHRQEKGLSLENMAELMEISVTELENFEAGKVKMDINMLWHFACVLGAPINKLFADVGAGLNSDGMPIAGFFNNY